MRIKKIINYGVLDITPISQYLPTKKCIVISWENWLSDLGSERVKLVSFVECDKNVEIKFTLQTFHVCCDNSWTN